MTSQHRSNCRAGFPTRAIHHGYDPMAHDGALTAPIYMTSTYALESAEAGRDILTGARTGYLYGRTRNPTQALLEERLASLEGAEAGLVFASGMGAISSVMWSLLKAGDEVVASNTLYGNSYTLLTEGMAQFGIKIHLADFSRLDRVGAALTPRTKLIYFETPANPNVLVIDLAGVAEIARGHGALTAVDSTFASPALQRPAEFGIDLVLHSATKFLGGHGDLLGGVLAGRAALVDQVRKKGLRYLTGATLSPMNAFLILRGLKTLAIRMERHCANAQKIAEWLERHPKVAAVSYPGLESFPQRDIVRRQMDGAGSLLSFELKGDLAAGMKLLNSVELITRAVSLGDAETLIQHPASMTHASYPAEERRRYGIGDSLIRLSVGLEDADDLIADLDQALERVE
ncbi:MAG: aminotransferase class I/II-fold pyridoxal phosphate-dependent enzyme [Alphaproteobacteria bacterium]|nr:aminotransferase class I/II-fold pyridoxal phosphate-dependent enzyme [Alphaproteobacteria bacterium]